jgi:Cu(I)/Ag(I) efflux system membrane fusion protein
MDLIPVETTDAGQGEGGRAVLELSDQAMKLAEIQTVPVVRGRAGAEIRLVGKLEPDETRVRDISAWVPGRIERLYVNFTGVRVKKGDPLIELYSPDLITAQEELLQAVRTSKAVSESGLEGVRTSADAMVEAARQKLRLLGLSARQVEQVQKRGKVQTRVVIPAPVDGVVIHKAGLEGMYVETGTHIYAIADLTHLWAKLDAYESDLPWIRLGQEVLFDTEAFPGRTFRGEVAFIDPVLDRRTRTAKVRLEVRNTEGLLKPEMFVRAVVHATLEEREEPRLLIPASAPLITGRRAVVYVQVPDAEVPTFEGREVVLGPRAGNAYVVESGLREGERVVVKGAFKIDSAMQIQAKPSMMLPEGGAPPTGHEGHSMEGQR